MKSIHNFPAKSLVLIVLVVFFSCSENGQVDPVETLLAVDEEEEIIDEKTILIDASHDGGTWWFPQSSTDGFNPSQEHQGKPLADYLRSLGYDVRELGSGTNVTWSLLSKYNKVIRAGKYGGYSATELQAYDKYIERGSSLILIGEFLRQGQVDELAENLGIKFRGKADGTVTSFADHAITSDSGPIRYIAGSVVTNAEENKDIEILGWLPEDTRVDYMGRKSSGDPVNNGIPVMGILHHPNARIFFTGELNGMEQVPRPFTENLVKWAFGESE